MSQPIEGPHTVWAARAARPAQQRRAPSADDRQALFDGLRLLIFLALAGFWIAVLRVLF